VLGAGHLKSHLDVGNLWEAAYLRWLDLLLWLLDVVDPNEAARRWQRHLLLIIDLLQRWELLLLLFHVLQLAVHLVLHLL